MYKRSWAALKRWIDQKKNMGKFFGYFIVGNMLVAGLFGTLLYMVSAHSLETETIEANQNMLLQLNKSVDLLLSQVDLYLGQLSLDPSVADFMQYYNSKDLLTQIRVNAVIDNNLLLTRYINSISIFYFHENKVYSTNRGVRDLNDFPDREIFERAKSGRLNYNNWLPTRKFFDEKSGKTINVITFVKPIPIGSFEPIAVAIVNIEESYLRDSMNSIITKDELEIFVIDDQARFISGNKIARSNIDLSNKPYLKGAFQQKAGNYLGEVDREKVLISFVTSEAYGWKYISVIPYKVIVKKIGFIRNYAIIISFLAIILGVLISLFFSNRIFKPINLIAGLFKNNDDQPGENDILKYIEKSVNRLVEKNESIEKTFSMHLPVLRNNFLTSFLMGAVPDNQEVEERFKYYGIDLGKSSCYIVYLISLNNYNHLSGKVSERQLNILVIYLMEILNDLANRNHRKIVVNTKANEIAMVFAINNVDEESINPEIVRMGAEIQQAIQANANYTFAIAAGSWKKELSQIADSYNEALEALHYKILIGNHKVIRYEDIQNLKEENYEYPYEKEKELMDAMKQGDSESVTRISHDIFRFLVNCSESLGDSVYYYYMQLLSSTIRRTLRIGINIESVLGEANLYKELLKCNGTTEIQDWFTYLFKELTEHVQKRKLTKNRGIIESIVSYIRENYDQDLSLTALSQQVFLSVPYLSTIFREEYGKPLKQFINEVRIEKAKEFLADPNYQIVEVAEKVGYDKVHAFLRLFKEATGMTPGQYRKTIAFNEKRDSKVIQFDSSSKVK